MESTTAPEPIKRRRGRPRKSDPDRDVRRSEIIHAAIRLFAEYSYHDVTMSDIARAVGLNQSSLYYWFKDKESVLECILKDSSASSELVGRLSELSGDNELRLYAVVYADAKTMCDFPFDYFDLEAIALAHPDRFASFFETYGSLRKLIEQIVIDGVEAGSFANRTSPALMVNVVLSITEGLQHQYHRSKHMQEIRQDDSWGGVALRSSDGLAKLAADSALCTLRGATGIEALYSNVVAKGWIAQ